MKYIRYDAVTIMTGDEIADAVVEYAAMLGANGRTDTVEVPTFDEHGARTTATLLLGPASELVLEHAPDDELEPEDPEFVALLRLRGVAAGPDGPVHAG